jgi:hypothetical protein
MIATLADARGKNLPGATGASLLTAFVSAEMKAGNGSDHT